MFFIFQLLSFDLSEDVLDNGGGGIANNEAFREVASGAVHVAEVGMVDEEETGVHYLLEHKGKSILGLAPLPVLKLDGIV